MVAITAPRTFGPDPYRACRVPTAVVYRRRRLAVAGVAALLVALALLLGELAARRPAPEPTAPVARVSVVVRPGDTVWSIGARVAGDRDPRPVVDAIVEANGGAGLVAGQRLELTIP